MTTLKIAVAIVVVFAGIGSSSIAQELEFKVEMFKVYAYDANGNEAPFVATQEISLKRKHSGVLDDR
jgi:hypothetical protein